MYLRAIHAELHIPSLRQFIRDNPLGIVVTALKSPNFPTLQCTHIPWVLDIRNDDDAIELGTLRGHMARANPHAKAMTEVRNASNGYLADEVSVIFSGPVHSYVTPKFYVNTKPATGKVVPTWNYAAVQAYGRAKIYCDSAASETSSYLKSQLDELTNHAENSVMGFTGQNNKPTGWKVSDAPEPFINLLHKSIIGIEIEVTRLEGKFKMSQEMGKADREGVIEGFQGLGTEDGETMATIVAERGAMKDAKVDG